MMKMDYHMHTHWSPDGRMTMGEALETCRRRGVVEVAFTEHVDLRSPYPEDSESNIAACHAEIEAMRLRFPEISIRKGIEVGVFRDNIEETARFIERHEPDFVIASVHSFRCGDLYSREASQVLPLRQFFRMYLEEILFAARNLPHWSVLGHLDYPLRYYDISEEDLLACADVVDEILSVAVSRGRGIEMNLSGIRKIGRVHPAVWILSRFLELGGRVLTVGSDAHEADHIASPWEVAEEILAGLGNPPLTRFSAMKPMTTAP